MTAESHRSRRPRVRKPAGLSRESGWVRDAAPKATRSVHAFMSHSQKEDGLGDIGRAGLGPLCIISYMEIYNDLKIKV